MPRVYDYDFRHYVQPKYRVANEPRHTGNGLGNEYFRATNYSTFYDMANEKEKQFDQETDVKEGEGIIDTALNVGKTAINFAKNNKELISAIGSVAGAASQISRAQEASKQLEAIQRIRDIRHKAEEAQMGNTSTPTTTPTSPATPSDKIQKLKDNFTGRGVRKRGGILKAF